MWIWLKTGRLCIKYFSPQGATVCEGAPLQNPQNLPQILLPLFIVCSLMEIVSFVLQSALIWKCFGI